MPQRLRIFVYVKKPARQAVSAAQHKTADICSKHCALPLSRYAILNHWRLSE